MAAERAMFFTRDEVVIHNSRDDMWVIVNGAVFDLTNLFVTRMELNSVNDVRIFSRSINVNAFHPYEESAIVARPRRQGLKLVLQ